MINNPKSLLLAEASNSLIGKTYGPDFKGYKITASPKTKAEKDLNAIELLRARDDGVQFGLAVFKAKVVGIFDYAADAYLQSISSPLNHNMGLTAVRRQYNTYPDLVVGNVYYIANDQAGCPISERKGMGETLLTGGLHNDIAVDLDGMGRGDVDSQLLEWVDCAKTVINRFLPAGKYRITVAPSSSTVVKMLSGISHDSFELGMHMFIDRVGDTKCFTHADQHWFLIALEAEYMRLHERTGSYPIGTKGHILGHLGKMDGVTLDDGRWFYDKPAQIAGLDYSKVVAMKKGHTTVVIHDAPPKVAMSNLNDYLDVIQVFKELDEGFKLRKCELFTSIEKMQERGQISQLDADKARTTIANYEGATKIVSSRMTNCNLLHLWDEAEFTGDYSNVLAGITYAQGLVDNKVTPVNVGPATTKPAKRKVGAVKRGTSVTKASPTVIKTTEWLSAFNSGRTYDSRNADDVEKLTVGLGFDFEGLISDILTDEARVVDGPRIRNITNYVGSDSVYRLGVEYAEVNKVVPPRHTVTSYDDKFSIRFGNFRVNHPVNLTLDVWKDGMVKHVARPVFKPMVRVFDLVSGFRGTPITEKRLAELRGTTSDYSGMIECGCMLTENARDSSYIVYAPVVGYDALNCATKEDVDRYVTAYHIKTKYTDGRGTNTLWGYVSEDKLTGVHIALPKHQYPRLFGRNEFNLVVVMEGVEKLYCVRSALAEHGVDVNRILFIATLGGTRATSPAFRIILDDKFGDVPHLFIPDYKVTDGIAVADWDSVIKHGRYTCFDFVTPPDPQGKTKLDAEDFTKEQFSEVATRARKMMADSVDSSKIVSTDSVDKFREITADFIEDALLSDTKFEGVFSDVGSGKTTSGIKQAVKEAEGGRKVFYLFPTNKLKEENLPKFHEANKASTGAQVAILHLQAKDKHCIHKGIDPRLISCSDTHLGCQKNCQYLKDLNAVKKSDVIVTTAKMFEVYNRKLGWMGDSNTTVIFDDCTIGHYTSVELPHYADGDDAESAALNELKRLYSALLTELSFNSYVSASDLSELRSVEFDVHSAKGEGRFLGVDLKSSATLWKGATVMLKVVRDKCAVALGRNNVSCPATDDMYAREVRISGYKQMSATEVEILAKMKELVNTLSLEVHLQPRIVSDYQSRLPELLVHPLYNKPVEELVNELGENGATFATLFQSKYGDEYDLADDSMAAFLKVWNGGYNRDDHVLRNRVGTCALESLGLAKLIWLTATRDIGDALYGVKIDWHGARIDTPHVHLLHLPTGAGKKRLRECKDRNELNALICNIASFFFGNEAEKVGMVVPKLILDDVNVMLDEVANTANHYNAVGVNTMKDARVIARIINPHPAVTVIQAKYFARTGILVEDVEYRVGTGLNAGWRFKHAGLNEVSEDVMSSDAIQGFGRQRAGMRQGTPLVQVLIGSMSNKTRKYMRERGVQIHTLRGGLSLLETGDLATLADKNREVLTKVNQVLGEEVVGAGLLDNKSQVKVVASEMPHFDAIDYSETAVIYPTNPQVESSVVITNDDVALCNLVNDLADAATRDDHDQWYDSDMLGLGDYQLPDPPDILDYGVPELDGYYT